MSTPINSSVQELATTLPVVGTLDMAEFEEQLDMSIVCNSGCAHECTSVASYVAHACTMSKFWCEGRYQLWLQDRDNPVGGMGCMHCGTIGCFLTWRIVPL